MRKTLLVIDVLMAVVFITCVVLQYNDPDPLTWMPMYGSAAVVCVLYAASFLRWWTSAAVGVFALVWALTIAPRVVGKVHIGDMVESMQAKGGVEELREMGGLLIVAVWMLVLTVATRRSAAAGGSQDRA